MGVQQFAKMMETDSPMDDSQKAACRMLIARLMATKLGRQAAIDLDRNGIAAVVQCLDHLQVPVWKMVILLTQRDDVLSQNGWQVVEFTEHGGYYDIKDVYRIKHKKWTDNTWWNEDKIRTESNELFKKIRMELSTNNFNDQGGHQTVLERTVWFV